MRERKQVGLSGATDVLPTLHGELAVAVGFEPTEELPPHTLSRRAPSAARTRHRRRDYPITTWHAGIAVRGEEVPQQGPALVRQDAR